VAWRYTHALSLALAQMAPAKTADTAKGKASVDGKGMTLYTFDKDAGGKSMCNGPCADNWPPLVASADAKAMGDWTLVAREDGKMMWAYKGSRFTLGKRIARLAIQPAMASTTAYGIWLSPDPQRSKHFAAASAIYKKWMAGCSVPSNPTIAKIANPRAISIALLRSS
jgi:predicted lipoprotein with Yx(FWY)xxD motif